MLETILTSKIAASFTGLAGGLIQQYSDHLAHKRTLEMRKLELEDERSKRKHELLLLKMQAERDAQEHEQALDLADIEAHTKLVTASYEHDSSFTGDSWVDKFRKATRPGLVWLLVIATIGLAAFSIESVIVQQLTAVTVSWWFAARSRVSKIL